MWLWCWDADRRPFLASTGKLRSHQVFPDNPVEQIRFCHSSRMQNQTADWGTMQLIESRYLFSMSGTHCMLNIDVTWNQTNRFISNQIRGLAFCWKQWKAWTFKMSEWPRGAIAAQLWPFWCGRIKPKNGALEIWPPDRGQSCPCLSSAPAVDAHRPCPCCERDRQIC